MANSSNGGKDAIISDKSASDFEYAPAVGLASVGSEVRTSFSELFASRVMIQHAGWGNTRTLREVRRRDRLADRSVSQRGVRAA